MQTRRIYENYLRFVSGQNAHWRLRVVCGFALTPAIGCPISRLSSVLFPAFGLPTIDTNPERIRISHCFFLSCTITFKIK